MISFRKNMPISAQIISCEGKLLTALAICFHDQVYSLHLHWHVHICNLQCFERLTGETIDMHNMFDLCNIIVIHHVLHCVQKV
jgi:hypothetical protein